MEKILILYGFILLFVLLSSPSYASTICTGNLQTFTNFDIICPGNVATTVGKLTTLQINLYNHASQTDSYTVTISSLQDVPFEITSPSIAVSSMGSGSATTVATGIRPLTDDNNRITVTILSTQTNEQEVMSISTTSSKLSLPEFNISGLIQIIGIASIIYYIAFKKP